MTTVFLVCAVVGGTILAFQFVMTLIGFGEGDLDSVDDLPDSFESFDSPEVGDVHGSTSAFSVLSFKSVVAAITFFGIAGMATERAGFATIVQLAAAASAGVAAMYGVYYLLMSVAKLAQAGNLRTNNAIGKTATVNVAVPSRNAGRGKVQVKIQNRLEEFAALTSSDQKLASGAKAVVVNVIDGNTLQVEPISGATNGSE